MKWTKRRWGYVVWGVALFFVFVPEILAAIPLTESQLPFPTISRMTGHLEYAHNEWEIAPTVFIVFTLLSLLRVPVRQRSGGNDEATLLARRAAGDTRPHRTPGGRLTFEPDAKTAEAFDNEAVSSWAFAARAAAAAAVTIALTLWALHHWPNQYVTDGSGNRHKLPNFHVAYFLYGSIGFFWLLLPSVSGLLAGKDAQFPNLFRTAENLEQWIAKPRGPAAVARLLEVLAWLLAFALIWGMVFLMLHLTLYPFPNITHILNPGG
ncbi:MAG TPA: hypothetical protein VGU02_09995 [Gaiellaceae bacterium]|nr:hypothetical protein [Gaiellaceae bacterium]